MHPCLGNWLAIRRGVVYYARAAHAFSAGITCRHGIAACDGDGDGDDDTIVMEMMMIMEMVMMAMMKLIRLVIREMMTYSNITDAFMVIS